MIFFFFMVLETNSPWLVFGSFRFSDMLALLADKGPDAVPYMAPGPLCRCSSLPVDACKGHLELEPTHKPTHQLPLWPHLQM